MAKAEDLIGVWRLVSYEMETAEGERAKPFGERPKGRLVYTAGGVMSAHLGAADGPAFADLGDSNEARALAAMRRHFSYSGRWRLEGDQVIHDVDLSIFPDWIGGVQERGVMLDGEDLILTMDAREPRLGRGAGVGRLRWRREE